LEPAQIDGFSGALSKMFEDLVSPEVASLVPYPPGKPQEELERELGIRDSIKLASNENPLGPSPKALAAVAQALGRLHRYPDGQGYYLKEALARRLGVAMNQIVLGNGSNEVIELCVRTFLRPGTNAVFSDPTFLVYSKVVQGAGGRMTRVPLKGLRHDLAGLRAAVDDQTRLIFLDNPNNPTGALVSRADIEAFIRDLPRLAVLVLDEAYVDFVRHGERIEPRAWIETDHPILFLRTFSKAYGLAGLRIGYGLAHRELVDYLDRVRQPFNVSSLAQAGALAALEDDDFYRLTLETTWAGLDWLKGETAALGFTAYATETNFMMIDLDREASDVAKAMLHEGVIVRSLASYGLPRTIRINAGTGDENRRFVAALKKVTAGNVPAPVRG
jgi:histidinol-phosphate aminotransferase